MFAGCFRQVALGIALLAVLAMALRLHVPSHVGCDHQHHSAEVQADAGPVLPTDLDPEGCDHCSCPAPVSGLETTSAHPVLPLPESVLSRPCQAADLPESRSYPPDPAPDRLS
jgi:hypothetical protein